MSDVCSVIICCYIHEFIKIMVEQVKLIQENQWQLNQSKMIRDQF